MATFLVIMHIMVSLFLIFIVLVQGGGKGAELGAAFGGSSQTLFGGRGAATFLNKMTTVVAVVFMLTSLLLAIVSTRGTSVVKPVPAKAMPAQQQPAPAPEGQIPAAAPQGQSPVSQPAPATK